MRPWTRYLRIELLALFALLGLGALFGLTRTSASTDTEPEHERIGENLDPFRTAFNEASGDVRAVLLVAPT